MAKLSWQDEYCVNIEEIDEQHRKLIELFNSLSEAIGVGDVNEEKVDKIIQELKIYASEHFATEEKYFKEFNYENADAHIEEHRRFVKEIERFDETYEKDPMKTAFELSEYLTDWLVNHLQDHDKKYEKWFKQKGVI